MKNYEAEKIVYLKKLVSYMIIITDDLQYENLFGLVSLRNSKNHRKVMTCLVENKRQVLRKHGVMKNTSLHYRVSRGCNLIFIIC